MLFVNSNTHTRTLYAYTMINDVDFILAKKYRIMKQNYSGFSKVL